MSKMSYCADGLVFTRGPAIDWSRFQVVPAGGAAVSVHDESQQERHRAAVARLEKLARDAQIAAKMDRAAELIERITAARNRPIPDAPNAGPTAWELMNQYQPSFEEMSRVSAEDMARRCAESEAAYAARNPHSKEGKQV